MAMQSSDHWHAEVARPNGTLPFIKVKKGKDIPVTGRGGP
jgi:hypothetical protein